jgi:tetratricopeptide (TPR) repeat protein
VLAFVCAGSGAATRADDVEALLATARAAEARHDPSAALAGFRAADAMRPNDPAILQAIAKQLSDATFLESDPARKQQHVEEALGYAQRALALDPDDAVNVLSLAILYAKLGLYAETSQRVEYARLIRQYAEQALALDPDYAWAHHVLGQWHVAMAELGATRRFLAGVFYGGLPRGSRATGLAHLERAVALAPDVLAHRVELGLACEAAKRTDEARRHWELALTLPVRDIHDPFVRQQAVDALQRTAPAATRSG